MDASKARQELGWEARHDFDETLRSTVLWYLSNSDWLAAANGQLQPGGSQPPA
jgi:dTDP-glucose 4,6-dehydratase